LGQTDISSASDTDVTPATCADIIQDFKPPPPGSEKGPPRQKFWSSKITELHERVHAADFKESVTDKVFGGLQDFLKQDSFCRECASDRPDEQLKEETIRLTGEFLADFDSDPVQNEIEAHDRSNPEYLKLIDGIRQRARSAPKSEGWPKACQ